MRFFALRKKGREVFTYGTKRQSVVSDSALSFCPHLTFIGCFIITRRFGVVNHSPRRGGGKCGRQASAADGSAQQREKNVSDRRRMASRLGKKRAFPLRKLRATRLAGPKNGSTPRCAVGNIKGGETSRRAFSPRLGAGAVFRRLRADRRILLRAVPSRLPCRFSGFVQMALRPDCRSFSQASCRRRRAARLRALPSAASPLRLREGGSPRSARRSPGPPSRCPAGGNSRRWRP